MKIDLFNDASNNVTLLYFIKLVKPTVSQHPYWVTRRNERNPLA